MRLKDDLCESVGLFCVLKGHDRVHSLATVREEDYNPTSMVLCFFAK